MATKKASRKRVTKKRVSGVVRTRDKEYRSLNQQLAYLAIQLSDCRSHLVWITDVMKAARLDRSLKEGGRRCR